MKRLLLSAVVFAFLQASSLAQVTADWTNKYSAPGDNSDRYNAMVPDGNGNFFLAGYTISPGTDKDFLLVKVNAGGDTLWTRTYNHSVNLADEALLLATDAAGNVYVSGTSDGGYSVSKNDMLTLKYNSSGSLLWNARYNYTLSNEDESPTGIAVDNAGNVFVTGRSDHDAGNVDDIVTVKYNSSGLQQWATRYNGLDNGIDRPVGVVPDQAGGCVVGGRYDSGVDDDFITIRYDASGSALWTSTYNNGFGSDRAAGFARDDSGNVYITGRSFNGADDDFTTIKYNGNGVQQWIAIYNSGNDDRAIALFVDDSRNVYVTGQTDGGSNGVTNNNFKTVKYNSLGVQLWVRANPGSPNHEDTPESLFADASGNVYITGKSDSSGTGIPNNQWMTVKLNASGTVQWTKFYNGSQPGGDDIPAAVYTDTAGNVYVSGSAGFNTTQKDAVILKYNSTGNLLSARKYNGAGDFTEKTKAMCRDKYNNLYLTGYTMGPGRQKDLFVQKISSSGTTQWFRTYDGTADNDEGNAIVCDTNGNIYVTGYSNGSGTYDDYITIKYSPSGDTLWTARYNFTARQDDRATAIAVSSSGIVYVTGYSDSQADPLITNYDYTTIKYNAGGLQLWVARYNGAGNGNDRAVKVLVAGNHIYVTGRSFNGLNEDIVTLDYSTAGIIQHTGIFNGNTAGDDQPADAALDGSTVYITGSGFAGTAAENIVLLKYNASLVQQWVSFYNGSGDSTDKAAAVAVNASGVYVAGRTINASGTEDAVTLKFSKSNGSRSWNKTFNGSAGLNDRGNSIALDPVGNVLVAGESVASNNLSDALLLNYNPSGSLNWSALSNGNANGEDSWKLVIPGTDGKIFTGGFITSSGTGFDINSKRYCSNPEASITAGGPTTICSGGQVLLQANTGAGLGYQWMKNAASINGATASSYPATSTGSYSVRVTAGGNCRTISPDKTINVQTVAATVNPPGPVTLCAGDSIQLQANTGNGLSYQWKKSGTAISGATSAGYTAKTTGTYKVVVTNTGGCAGTSGGTAVSINCREQVDAILPQEQLLLAYPNPFETDLTVQLPAGQPAGYRISLCDLSGRALWEVKAMNTEPFYFNGSGLEIGVYLLRVTAPGFHQTIRLLKQLSGN